MPAKRELQTVLTLKGEQEYSQKLKNIQGALGLIATEQSKLNSQYEKGDKSLAKLTQQHDILTRKLTEQRQKVALITKAYKESAAKGDEAAETTSALQRELNMASAAVNKTTRELEKLENQMGEASSRTKQFAQKLKEMGVTAESVGGNMQRVGNSISRISMAIASAVGVAAIKGWIQLEDEMANVSTIADTGEKSMAQLTDEVIAVSNVTGIAATEIAKAQYQTISAGIATAESAGLVEMAAMAAKAGVSDVTTVIEGSTSIINAWGIAMADSESIFDKLLKTQQRGKTTIGEIAGSIGQVTGLAPQLGITLDEILAAVATLTLSGVDTSTAMTGLKGVMSAIIKPTAEAREEAARLGIQFDAAAVETMGFTNFLAMVMEATDGDAESLAKLFGSVDALSQIMLLGGSSAATYADILDDLGNSAGTLDNMFGLRTSSSAERFALALNKINNAAIKLGQSLAPMIGAAADTIDSFADKLNSMSAEQAQNIISTTLWIAGISKGISVLGGLLKNLSAIKGAFGAVGALLGPAGPVVGGIAAAAAAAAGLGYVLSNVEPTLHLDLDGIDDSELENYHIEDFTYGEEVIITVNAKLQIKDDLDQWSDDIAEWLTDGKVETQEQLKGYEDEINTIVSEAFMSIDENYNTQRDSLNAQLEEGIITPKAHAKALKQLSDQTATMNNMLETDLAAVMSYVSYLVSLNRAATDEEIAELERLLGVLGMTTGYILDATDASRQAYEWAYKKTLAGVGTEQDLKLAAEWIEIQYKIDTQELEAQRQAINDKYAAMLTPDLSEEEVRRLAELEAEELLEIDKKAQEIVDQRTARYGELLTAEFPRTGLNYEDAKELEKYANEGKTEPSVLTSLARWNPKEFETISGLLEKMANADFSRVDFLLDSWATEANGGTEAISSLAGELGTLFELMGDTEDLETLPEDYEQIGIDAGAGLINGLYSQTDEAAAAGRYIGRVMADATRGVLKIHSPSRVFEQIGVFSMDGLINGVHKRLADVQKAYKTAVSPQGLNSGNAPAMPTAGTGTAGTTIINNVNYTAGAGTRRQARMLSQRLAENQKESRMAEGLYR